MATIIDFTTKLNERRASAKIAEIESNREQLAAAKMQEAVNHVQNGNIPAALAAYDDAQEAAKPVNYVCAYCDPSNEVKGSKYDSTRHLGHVEIAKMIRQDIKDATKRGQLAKGFKISVKCDSYSMGCSIDIRITALPEGVTPYSPEYLEATGNLNHPAEWGQFPGKSHYTPQVAAALELLEQIHDAYQRDNSDSMSDYYSRRYSGDVSLGWRIKH